MRPTSTPRATAMRCSRSAQPATGAPFSAATRSPRTTTRSRSPSMTERAEQLYHLDAARTAAQRQYMERLEAAGLCIFCREHIADFHAEPVEYDGQHWVVTKNAYPYTGTSAHYLIVARRHGSSFDELPDAAGGRLWGTKPRP